jgi:hypothetical protein
MGQAMDSVFGIIKPVSYGVAGVWGIVVAWRFFQGSPESTNKLKDWGIGLFFIVIINVILSKFGING